jgi:hypothetical protein
VRAAPPRPAPAPAHAGPPEPAPAPAPSPASTPARRPAGRADEEIVVHWRDVALLGRLVVAIVIPGAAGFIVWNLAGLPVAGMPDPFMVRLITTAVLSTGALVFMWVPIARVFNRSVIRIENGEIRATHGPLPGWSPTWVDTAEVEEITFDEDQRSSRNQRSSRITWEVVALHPDGTETIIVPVVGRERDALECAEAIAARIGVPGPREAEPAHGHGHGRGRRR